MRKENTTILSKRIKEARAAAGLSQTEAAGLIKVSRQTLNDYENGRSVPSIEKAILICEKFNTSPNYLLFGEVDDIKTTDDILKRKLYWLMSLVVDKDIRYDVQKKIITFDNEKLREVFFPCYVMSLKENNLAKLELMNKILEYIKQVK